MTFFESLLLLLAIAVGLLLLAHRLSIPYPTMLAAAGVVLALVPNTPAPPHRRSSSHPRFATHRTPRVACSRTATTIQGAGTIDILRAVNRHGRMEACQASITVMSLGTSHVS